MQEKNLNQPKNPKLEAVIEGIAHELGLVNNKRLVDDLLEPCIIVIMGASGDLVGRKLLPALFILYLQGGLPTPFTILGCSRTKMRDEQWRAKAKAAALDSAGFNAARWDAFSANLFYRELEYEEPASFDQHCRTGGAALFVPDCVKETFQARTDHGGHDRAGRAMRYLEWSYDPDEADSTFVTDYAFLLRDRDGVTRASYDHHVLGLFPRAAWVRILQESGFEVRIIEDGFGRDLFCGIKQ